MKLHIINLWYRELTCIKSINAYESTGVDDIPWCYLIWLKSLATREINQWMVSLIIITLLVPSNITWHVPKFSTLITSSNPINIAYLYGVPWAMRCYLFFRYRPNHTISLDNFQSHFYVYIFSLSLSPSLNLQTSICPSHVKLYMLQNYVTWNCAYAPNHLCLKLDEIYFETNIHIWKHICTKSYIYSMAYVCTFINTVIHLYFYTLEIFWNDFWGALHAYSEILLYVQSYISNIYSLDSKINTFQGPYIIEIDMLMNLILTYWFSKSSPIKSVILKSSVYIQN